MELSSDGRPPSGMSPSSPAGGHPDADAPPEEGRNNEQAASETRAIARLAAVTQLLLLGCIGVTIAVTCVELFGIATLTSYIDGDDSALDRLDLYDQLSLIAGALSSLLALAAGVTWLIWQFRVAKHVGGRTRRSPGWHAGSWFVPVINLWYPYQNIADLWRAVGSRRPPWQIVWWVLWISSNCVGLFWGPFYLAAEYAETLRDSMWVFVAADALLLAAAPLAILVVRGITRGVLQRSTAHHMHGS